MLSRLNINIIIFSPMTYSKKHRLKKLWTFLDSYLKGTTTGHQRRLTFHTTFILYSITNYFCEMCIFTFPLTDFLLQMIAIFKRKKIKKQNKMCITTMNLALKITLCNSPAFYVRSLCLETNLKKLKDKYS